jgi:hypothetical protein
MRAFLLALILALAAGACSGGETADHSAGVTPAPATLTPGPTPAPTPSPSPSPTPSPTPPPPPTLDVSGSQPRQGGFLLVRLLYPPAGLANADAYFNRTPYAMLPAGDRWFAMIGLPTSQSVGDFPVEVWSGETLLASGSISIAGGGFQFESIQVPPGPAGLLSDSARIEQERVRVEQVLSGFTPEKRWSGPWILPAQGSVSNAFGLQRSINGGPYYPHTGTDLANVKGTPIYAAATGVVALAESLFLYGNSVIIDHGAGVFGSYNHMDSLAVSAGQAVNKGDLIGYMGETGLVTGPHVHWEVIVRGVRVDPMLWTQAPVEP